jgi:hypothetical protein
VTEARPACLPAAYDLEMKFIGPDGGDSLRTYLRDIGSTRVHPLLTGWLDKLEPYRTDLAGLARYWAELDAYRAEMLRFLRDFDVILCPAYIHPALPHGESVRDENFRGFSHTMAYNVAGWPGVGSPLRPIEHRPADRRASGGRTLARRYRPARRAVLRGSAGRLDASRHLA